MKAVKCPVEVIGVIRIAIVYLYPGKSSVSISPG
jgi:hypothetical protein